MCGRRGTDAVANPHALLLGATSDPRGYPESPVSAPFDRLENESDPAWQAFVAYRDLGPERNIRKVAQSLSKSVALMGEWSSRHQWVARAAAWDAEVDRHRRAASLSAISEMVERHATHTQAQLQALMAPARELLKRLQQNPALLAEVSDAQLIRYCSSAARAVPALIQAERLARGLSTENIDVHANEASAKAAGQSDDELDAALLGIDAPEDVDTIDGTAHEAEAQTPPTPIEIGGG